jgi:non-ribosomal peptide synthetase component E (peptide arylation enzyme)
MAHATAGLAGYKRPNEIRVIDQMRLGVSGKVAMSVLKVQLVNYNDLNDRSVS